MELRNDARGALYLPDSAEQEDGNADEMLSRLCGKAGIGPDGCSADGVTLDTITTRNCTAPVRPVEALRRRARTFETQAEPPENPGDAIRYFGLN